MPKSEQACLKLMKNMIFCFQIWKNPAFRGVSSCALFTACEALRGQIYMGCIMCLLTNCGKSKRLTGNLIVTQL